MKILIVTPAAPETQGGNRMTALRYARVFRQLGHAAAVLNEYSGQSCDLMVALHAGRGRASAQRFLTQNPDKPLVVVLTGTDIYGEPDSRVTGSLKLATRIVALQQDALERIPRRFRGKARVIHQSARSVSARRRSADDEFRVIVIGHLRPVKDPFRAAMASRRLPARSRIRVLQIGRALDASARVRAEHYSRTNPRYEWLGELPHRETLRLLARSDLLVISSRIEGSSNTLSEALASNVPVLATKIPGLAGTLGSDYPGYFRVGDTAGLARLMLSVESDTEFRESIGRRCRDVAFLAEPAREAAAWKKLLLELRPGVKR